MKGNPEPISVSLDGKCYVFDGRRWFDKGSFEVPPAAIIPKLTALAAEAFKARDSALGSLDQILEEARLARLADQLGRSIDLARRSLEISPGNPIAIAILSASLRQVGKPEEALRETEAIQKPSAMILTTRAAALCDLERWEEAKATVGQALAMKKSEEAFAVVNRIKSVRPELYEK